MDRVSEFLEASFDNPELSSIKGAALSILPSYGTEPGADIPALGARAALKAEM